MRPWARSQPWKQEPHLEQEIEKEKEEREERERKEGQGKGREGGHSY